MKTENELKLLDKAFKNLIASINDMPHLKYVMAPEILKTIKVDAGGLETDLGAYREVLIVGEQAINTSITSVSTIIDVLLMSYLNQKGYVEIKARGFIGHVNDLGKLADVADENIFI